MLHDSKPVLNSSFLMRLAPLILMLGLLCVSPALSADHVAFPLPNPSDIGAEKFSEKLNAFVIDGSYHKWNHDLETRATGPYIVLNDGTVQSFGTHGPSGVRVFYSPGVWAWLTGGRKGSIADGEMIVKEMYPRDAANPEKFEKEAATFSIAIKDSKGSWDGWFWSDGGTLKKPEAADALKFFDPNAGFGQSCITCHSSTDNKESIFATLRSAQGPAPAFTTIVPTVPLPKVDKTATTTDIHTPTPTPAPNTAPAVKAPADSWKVPFSKKRRDYWNVFDKLPENFVPEPQPFFSNDHVAQGPQPSGQKQFITSSNCSGCHGATQFFATLPNMVHPVPHKNAETTLANLSPYSEWRYSMMGLSGRDPVFFAQLETERELHPELAKEIDNTCLSCHGVMGQREYTRDKGADALVDHKLLNATLATDAPNANYGALLRDGVSCAACHRALPDGLGTDKTYTGKFKVAEKANEIFGPYQQVAVLPMEQGLGLTPKYGEHIKSSKMCGSCHTVVVPSLEKDKKYTRPELEKASTFHEQTTYFEWKNSIFSDEEKVNPAKRSCQDCHMPKTFAGNPLKFKIATVEDNTFPANEGRAPDSKITLTVRGTDPKEPYSRHSLHGINTFVTEMFNQFPWMLGIQRRDNLFTADEGIAGPELAIQNGLELARQTAVVSITELTRTEKGLTATVKVENATGHKFPTGVALRRAFIELKVVSGDKTLWASGATDAWGTLGVLDDGKFTPLASELGDTKTFQPHYETISSQDQVQIYEEINSDSSDHVTTSFLGVKKPLKDNRILPQGWRANGPDAEFTQPIGGALKDKDYTDGSGSDSVRYEIPLKLAADQKVSVSATLYYQSLPPNYLKDRFKLIDKPATQNLFYFVNQLNLENSPMKDWKLEITSAQKAL